VLLTVLVAVAGPATAHAGNDDAADFRTEITSDPTPGLTWRVLGDGMLELHHTGGAEVVVAGYEDEPYLRFAPDGTVWRNAESPATYLNQSSDGDAPVPPQASAGLPPRWEKVAADGTFAWHDHRTHWMSGQAPSGDETRMVQAWTVPYRVGEAEPTALTGELWWTPPADPWLWLLGAVAVLVLPLVELLRRRSWDPTVAARVLGIEALVVAALNVVRAVDDVVTVDAPTADHVGVLVATAFWAGLSVTAAQFLVRRPERANLAVVAIAGISLSWGLGISTVSALSAGFVQTSLPLSVLRSIVALTVALAVPTAITAVLVERRSRAALVAARRPVTSAA